MMKDFLMGRYMKTRETRPIGLDRGKFVWQLMGKSITVSAIIIRQWLKNQD